jgi:hypothetical protein
MMDTWGCEKEAQLGPRYRARDEDGVLSHCPVRYVPNSIYDFMRSYKFHKDFPGAPMPSYDEINPRWLEAANVYESEYHSAREEVMKHGR